METTQRAAELLPAIRNSIEKVMVGKDAAIDLLLVALLAKGHALIEDVPGIGKTTLVSALARALSLSFMRIQFTPDVMPSDITGFTVMDFQSGQFAFHQGAVMSQIVLADEINRTSPKTQSSLLEAMQDRQVTVDGKTYPLPEPFMVLATQNPVDFAGTYPLPEAQLDRFLLRIRMGYPSMSEEVEIMTRAEEGGKMDSIEVVASPQDVVAMQAEAAAVHTPRSVREYISALCARTRDNEDIALGASPRAAISLNAAAKGLALLDGRGYVIPDDVQKLISPVWAHRVLLKPEARLRDMTPERALRNIVSAVRVPDAE